MSRYKGTPAIPAASAPPPIDLTGAFDQWQTVAPEYAAPSGDTQPRDFGGAGGTHYPSYTGRNDIVACKVTRGTKRVYFYVHTREPLTPPTDPNWMWLLIHSGDRSSSSWEGFNYIVNHCIEPDGTGAQWTNLS